MSPPNAQTPAKPGLSNKPVVYKDDNGNMQIDGMAALRELYGTFPKQGYTASDAEMLLFAEMIRAMGLNPALNEIILVPRRSNIARQGQSPQWITAAKPVVGYAVFLARADATGKLSGWKPEPILDEKTKALYAYKVTIWRKDWPDHPFEYTVLVAEIVGKGPMWQNRKQFMTMKTCIGQAFRLCFPAALSGMYLEEESESAAELIDTPAAPDAEQPAKPGLGTGRTAVEHKPGKPADAKVEKKEAVPAQPPRRVSIGTAEV